MAVDLVVSATNPTGCGHYVASVLVDDVSYVVDLHADDLSAAITADEVAAWVKLCIRRGGFALPTLAGRILRGEEATNVKQYDLIGPGSAITKTNIGTTYVDVPPGANGQRSLVDFSFCTEFRVILTANLVGTGPFGVRIVRDSDSAVLYEAASIALTGERELDTDWQPLPGAASGLALVRLQARSTVAADDPVFRRCVLVVR